MIVAGNKIYETCGKCGGLVQINKWLFGSIHYCWSPGESPDRGFVEKQKARTVMREALRTIGLTTGVDDDGFCCGSECGIRLGEDWYLCYGEYSRSGSRMGMLLFNTHPKFREYMYGRGIPKARVLAKWLRGILDKHDLWEELK